MECVAVGGVLFVVAIVAAIVIGISKAQAQEQARRAYERSLERLKRDPHNADLRQETLALGRVYSGLSRDHTGRTLFDEVALSNDIGAACAGAGRPVAAVSSVPVTPAVRYYCPHCRAQLESSADSVGQDTSCPFCHQGFRVPSPRPAPRVIAPPSVPAPPPPRPPVVFTAQIRYGCPHCGTTIESPAEDAGRVVSCPMCERTFQVPT